MSREECSVSMHYLIPAIQEAICKLEECFAWRLRMDNTACHENALRAEEDSAHSIIRRPDSRADKEGYASRSGNRILYKSRLDTRNTPSRSNEFGGFYCEEARLDVCQPMNILRGSSRKKRLKTRVFREANRRTHLLNGKRMLGMIEEDTLHAHCAQRIHGEEARGTLISKGIRMLRVYAHMRGSDSVTHGHEKRVWREENEEHTPSCRLVCRAEKRLP